jgi:tetrahydrodipicolinate N-succinyltransferase
VGKHAVVAPGSVVTVDVPPYHVVAGNPARVVKRLPEEHRGDGGNGGGPVAGPAAHVVTTLEAALLVGLDDQEQGEELGRVAAVVGCVDEWTRQRRAMWRREGGGGGYDE